MSSINSGNSEIFIRTPSSFVDEGESSYVFGGRTFSSFESESVNQSSALDGTQSHFSTTVSWTEKIEKLFFA